MCPETLQSLTCFLKWWKRGHARGAASTYVSPLAAAAPSRPPHGPACSTRCILQIRNCIGLPRQQHHHHTYTHGHHITAAACCFGIYYTYFCPNGPTLIQSIYVCMWILPLFPPKMAKNWKGARFWQSRAARVVKSAIRNNKAHACRCALVWAVGPSAGGKSVVVEGVAVHFCTKFALADGMHCNFRPSENSATSPTALATLSLALACHALARRAQWLVNFCKYIHVYLQKLLCLESES